MSRGKEMSLVTVGVASYNNASYIIETLNSIANQTYKNIEVLINDDASTDNSVVLIKGWIQEHPEIQTTLFLNQTNQGICKAGNNILRNAKGKYVCLIGSDDRYMPEFVEKRINLLEETDELTGFCYSLTYVINTEGERTGIDTRPTPSGYVFENMTSRFDSLCKPFTCLVKASCYQKIGYYDETLLFEDLDWLLRATKEYKALYLDSVDTEFRVVPGSLGTKLSSQAGMISQLSIIKKHLGYSSETDKNFRMRLWKLAMDSYKCQLPASREILNVSINYYNGVKEALLYLLTFIPAKWLIKAKHILKYI